VLQAPPFSEFVEEGKAIVILPIERSYFEEALSIYVFFESEPMLQGQSLLYCSQQIKPICFW